MKAPIDTVAMSPLRPLSFRLRRRQTSPTVESLSNLLESLARERQELRSSGAGSVVLEQNRVQIARAQWELSHALIERYLPKPAAVQSAA